jgi:hypothetical protein
MHLVADDAYAHRRRRCLKVTGPPPFREREAALEQAMTNPDDPLTPTHLPDPLVSHSLSLITLSRPSSLQDHPTLSLYSSSVAYTPLSYPLPPSSLDDPSMT